MNMNSEPEQYYFFNDQLSGLYRDIFTGNEFNLGAEQMMILLPAAGFAVLKKIN
jgi:hypothetical protein